MKNTIFLFLLTIGLNLQANIISDKSKILKMQGDTAFLKNNFEKAITFYNKAILEDKTNYFAYYNIARSLCELRMAGGDPCDILYIDGKEFNLQQSSIFNYIREGILLSQEVIRLMEKDTSITCLYSSLEYHFHMGKQLNKPVDFQNMLTIVNWRVNYVGEEEWTLPEGKIKFTKDLRFEFELFDLKLETVGSYTITPYHLKLKFDKPFLGKKQIWGMIKNDSISLLGLIEKEIIIWNTTEECSF